MVDPQNIRNEFYAAVDSPNKWQRLGHLLRKIKRAPAPQIYEAFFGVFTETSRPDSRFQDQDAAGGMLWKLKPHCQINLKDSITAVLSTYDLSIEELPWFYVEIFGKEVVHKAVVNLLNTEMRSKERETLKTFLFWLGAKPEHMKQSLKNKWKKIKG